jgi:quinol monooxygenase YgiN
MSETVLLRAKVEESKIDQFVCFIAELLSGTRDFPGCINIDIYQNDSNPEEFTFYENWESIEHYERYLAMRSEQGVMDTMASMLQTPPDIQHFKRLGI